MAIIAFVNLFKKNPMKFELQHGRSKVENASRKNETTKSYFMYHAFC